MLNKLYNRCVNYPFMQQTSLIGTIKQCRICLLVPGLSRRVRVRVSEIQKSTQQADISFTVCNDQGSIGSFTYSRSAAGTSLTANSGIVLSDSYMELAQIQQFPDSATQTPYIHPQCVHVVTQGVTLSVKAQTKVSTTARVYSQHEWKQAPQLQRTSIAGGYNCSISFVDNTLSISSFPGEGWGKHSGYSQWTDFSSVVPGTSNADRIDAYLAGVQSINGQTGSVSISVGSSLQLAQSTGSNDSLTLNISIKEQQSK